MKESLIIALLSLVSIGSLAAVFVLWAKLDEQKKLTQEEKEKRWDEISRAAGLENIIEDRTRDISYYHEITCKHTESIIRLTSEKLFLQDKLSALLCPRNDHVWKDGVCMKCGRVQDG